ncbi:MAG TPA: gluconokinase [Terriglobales bacterium]|jgi:gluconokinase
MVVIVMGVTGAGKTTVGNLLAEQLGWKFADADSFHSAANVEKMRRGIPLGDADRAPWLQAMQDAISGWIAGHGNVVLACSALKQSYRDALRVGPEVKIVYLKGSEQLISSRLRQRHGHFAGESILTAQFSDLEEPADAIVVDVSLPPEELVREIRVRLNI